MDFPVKINATCTDPSKNWRALGSIEYHGLNIKFTLKKGKYGEFLELGNSQKGKDKWYPGAWTADKTIQAKLLEVVQSAVSSQAQ